ncbi:hypothetical protein HanPI659440_Chr13g0488901 [Helianthus annuus]|nr:hypothetical protein HanPI659440_Chr13g0488901 [Helianthus annuus]
MCFIAFTNLYTSFATTGLCITGEFELTNSLLMKQTKLISLHSMIDNTYLHMLRKAPSVFAPHIRYRMISLLTSTLLPKILLTSCACRRFK